MQITFTALSALSDESFSICKFEEQSVAPVALFRNGAMHTLLS
jgi:hypothetical protein